jgi:diaminohydroxyphosphoribosylaminopyrimidine deaminase / 5-amino-6-(5-phosphoribosylamino)uracil reductase
MTDFNAMKRAIKLACRGIGFVSPNPLVGAVILKNGYKVSEGWHKKFGANHAEIDAINNAGKIDLEGTTLVINLEPCSHFSKTPPCVNAIIEKKISRVVVAMSDPNPLVAGKGFAKLKSAGIKVEVGLLEQEARQLNRFFIHHITTGLPYVILKVAQSFDGCIAASDGESKWITGEESRRSSHLLRSEADAMLIGRQTALFDNPSMTVRNVKGRNPKRIILDSKLKLPVSINAFKDADKNSIFVLCSIDAALSPKAQSLRKKGINVIASDTSEKEKINLRTALRKLYKVHNIASILVEGGASVYSSFLSEDLVQEIHFFISPKIIGNGRHSFEDFSINSLKDAAQFKITSLIQSGEDIHIVAQKN